MILHRHHLGTRMRAASLEISLFRGSLPEASSVALALMLPGRLTSPSRAAVRAERLARVHEAINSLDPLDREALAPRHYEQLGRVEGDPGPFTSRFGSRGASLSPAASPFYHEFSNVLGGLHLRGGRLDDAIARLGAGIAADPVEVPTDRAFPARAHAREGDRA